ncbi:unnamed protein product [Amoebophrya sp. A25]|nr:unnamed protein product [Amoebophrya sp. A25]|eukprot:GSA25T00025751001.1
MRRKRMSTSVTVSQRRLCAAILGLGGTAPTRGVRDGQAGIVISSSDIEIEADDISSTNDPGVNDGSHRTGSGGKSVDEDVRAGGPRVLLDDVRGGRVLLEAEGDRTRGSGSTFFQHEKSSPSTGGQEFFSKRNKIKQDHFEAVEIDPSGATFDFDTTDPGAATGERAAHEDAAYNDDERGVDGEGGLTSWFIETVSSALPWQPEDYYGSIDGQHHPEDSARYLPSHNEGIQHHVEHESYVEQMLEGHEQGEKDDDDTDVLEDDALLVGDDLLDRDQPQDEPYLFHELQQLQQEQDSLLEVEEGLHSEQDDLYDHDWDDDLDDDGMVELDGNDYNSAIDEGEDEGAERFTDNGGSTFMEGQGASSTGAHQQDESSQQEQSFWTQGERFSDYEQAVRYRADRGEWTLEDRAAISRDGRSNRRQKMEKSDSLLYAEASPVTLKVQITRRPQPQQVPRASPPAKAPVAEPQQPQQAPVPTP